MNRPQDEQLTTTATGAGGSDVIESNNDQPESCGLPSQTDLPQERAAASSLERDEDRRELFQEDESVEVSVQQPQQPEAGDDDDPIASVETVTEIIDVETWQFSTEQPTADDSIRDQHVPDQRGGEDEYYEERSTTAEEEKLLTEDVERSTEEKETQYEDELEPIVKDSEAAGQQEGEERKYAEEQIVTRENEFQTEDVERKADEEQLEEGLEARNGDSEAVRRSQDEDKQMTAYELEVAVEMEPAATVEDRKKLEDDDDDVDNSEESTTRNGLQAREDV